MASRASASHTRPALPSATTWYGATAGTRRPSSGRCCWIFRSSTSTRTNAHWLRLQGEREMRMNVEVNTRSTRKALQWEAYQKMQWAKCKALQWAKRKELQWAKHKELQWTARKPMHKQHAQTQHALAQAKQCCKHPTPPLQPTCKPPSSSPHSTPPRTRPTRARGG